MAAGQYLGEIRMFGFNFAPQGWAKCDGQLIGISQNTALFSLLGVTYGGDGGTTFALPDLRGRMPMHEGQGPGLTLRIRGQRSGTETNVLNATQLPIHDHTVNIPVTGTVTLNGNEDGADTNSPNNGTLTEAAVYSTGAPDPGVSINGLNANLTASGNTGNAGGSQPVNNMPPFLVVNFCIALQGIFPPRG